MVNRVSLCIGVSIFMNCQLAAATFPLIQYKQLVDSTVEYSNSRLKRTDARADREEQKLGDMQVSGASYLKRLFHVGLSTLNLLWIYLLVGSRYLRWRCWLWLKQKRFVEKTQVGMKQTVLIIRHGQTIWNVEHRLPGQLAGVALNDYGRQQAARLAEALTVLPISAIISSPLERAMDTASYLAHGRNLHIEQEPDLMDTDVGPWAGQIIEDLSKNDSGWKAYVKDPTVAPPGVETFPQVQQRVVAAVERWRKREGIGSYPAFVAHADVVKLLIAYYTGLDAGRAGSLMIDNASVSLLEIEDDQHPRVLAIGWNPQPGWLKFPEPAAAKTDTVAQETGEQKT